MLIIGAGGLAKELLEIAYENKIDKICFYDDIDESLLFLFEQFKILKNIEQVEKLFSKNNLFTIGIGNPVLRKKMCDKFFSLGGTLSSLVSLNAKIGSFGTNIQEGANVLQGSIITNGCQIGKCVLINPNVTISHDVILGDFVECSPGVCITGRVQVGDFSYIGTNATILPNLKIGTNVIIGAGAVVTRNVESNSLVVGIPAKTIKKLNPIKI